MAAEMSDIPNSGPLTFWQPPPGCRTQVAIIVIASAALGYDNGATAASLSIVPTRGGGEEWRKYELGILSLCDELGLLFGLPIWCQVLASLSAKPLLAVLLPIQLLLVAAYGGILAFEFLDSKPALCVVKCFLGVLQALPFLWSLGWCAESVQHRFFRSAWLALGSSAIAVGSCAGAFVAAIVQKWAAIEVAFILEMIALGIAWLLVLSADSGKVDVSAHEAGIRLRPWLAHCRILLTHCFTGFAVVDGLAWIILAGAQVLWFYLFPALWEISFEENLGVIWLLCALLPAVAGGLLAHWEMRRGLQEPATAKTCLRQVAISAGLAILFTILAFGGAYVRFLRLPDGGGKRFTVDDEVVEDASSDPFLYFVCIGSFAIHFLYFICSPMVAGIALEVAPDENMYSAALLACLFRQLVGFLLGPFLMLLAMEASETAPGQAISALGAMLAVAIFVAIAFYLAVCIFVFQTEEEEDNVAEEALKQQQDCQDPASKPRRSGQRAKKKAKGGSGAKAAAKKYQPADEGVSAQETEHGTGDGSSSTTVGKMQESSERIGATEEASSSSHAGGGVDEIVVQVEAALDASASLPEPVPTAGAEFQGVPLAADGETVEKEDRKEEEESGTPETVAAASINEVVHGDVPQAECDEKKGEQHGEDRGTGGSSLLGNDRGEVQTDSKLQQGCETELMAYDEELQNLLGSAVPKESENVSTAPFTALPVEDADSVKHQEDHSICDGVADEVESGATAADEQHCQGLVAVKEPEMPASDIAIEVWDDASAGDVEKLEEQMLVDEIVARQHPKHEDECNEGEVAGEVLLTNVHECETLMTQKPVQGKGIEELHEDDAESKPREDEAEAICMPQIETGKADYCKPDEERQIVDDYVKGEDDQAATEEAGMSNINEERSQHGTSHSEEKREAKASHQGELGDEEEGNKQIAGNRTPGEKNIDTVQKKTVCFQEDEEEDEQEKQERQEDGRRACEDEASIARDFEVPDSSKCLPKKENPCDEEAETEEAPQRHGDDLDIPYEVLVDEASPPQTENVSCNGSLVNTDDDNAGHFQLEGLQSAPLAGELPEGERNQKQQRQQDSQEQEQQQQEHQQQEFKRQQQHQQQEFERRRQQQQEEFDQQEEQWQQQQQEEQQQEEQQQEEQQQEEQQQEYQQHAQQDEHQQQLEGQHQQWHEKEEQQQEEEQQEEEQDAKQQEQSQEEQDEQQHEKQHEPHYKQLQEQTWEAEEQWKKDEEERTRSSSDSGVSQALDLEPQTYIEQSNMCRQPLVEEANVVEEGISGNGEAEENEAVEELQLELEEDDEELQTGEEEEKKVSSEAEGKEGAGGKHEADLGAGGTGRGRREGKKDEEVCGERKKDEEVCEENESETCTSLTTEFVQAEMKPDEGSKYVNEEDVGNLQREEEEEDVEAEIAAKPRGRQIEEKEAYAEKAAHEKKYVDPWSLYDEVDHHLGWKLNAEEIQTTPSKILSFDDADRWPSTGATCTPPLQASLWDSPSGKDVSDVEVDDEREPGDRPQGLAMQSESHGIAPIGFQQDDQLMGSTQAKSPGFGHGMIEHNGQDSPVPEASASAERASMSPALVEGLSRTGLRSLMDSVRKIMDDDRRTP